MINGVSPRLSFILKLAPLSILNFKYDSSSQFALLNTNSSASDLKQIFINMKNPAETQINADKHLLLELFTKKNTIADKIINTKNTSIFCSIYIVTFSIFTCFALLINKAKHGQKLFLYFLFTISSGGRCSFPLPIGIGPVHGFFGAMS